MAGTPATPTCCARRSTGGSVKTRPPDGARRPATLVSPADAQASVPDRKLDDLDYDQDHRDGQVGAQRAHAEPLADRPGRAPQWGSSTEAVRMTDRQTCTATTAAVLSAPTSMQ